MSETVFKGKYSSYDLRRTVRYRTYRMRSCYRKRLRNKPNIGGVVTALFTVDLNGEVTRASFAGFDAGVANCVRETLLPTKFRKVSEELRVRMKFKFRPNWRFSRPKGQQDDRDVLGAPAVDAARHRCAKRTPLRMSRETMTSVRRCFDPSAKRSVRLTAVLDVSSAGSVTGIEIRGVAKGEFPGCVADALRTVRFASAGSRRVACSLGFEAGGASREVGRAVRLDIGRGHLRVGRFNVGESMDLTTPAPGGTDPSNDLRATLNLRRWEQWYRDGRGWPVGGRGQLAIHAHPAVRVAALTKVLRLAEPERFSPVYFARAVGTSDLWHAVNPLGTPNWLCDGARAPLTITVTARTITVTAANGKIHTLARTERGGMGRLGALLRRLRAGGGPDVDIVGAADVAYRDVLNALEAAVGAGYFDARIVAADRV